MPTQQVRPKTTPIEVTFGIELELAIASVPDQFLDPQPDDPRRVHGITRPEDFNPKDFLPYIDLPQKENGVQRGWSLEWEAQFNALKRNIAKLLTNNGLPAVADCDYRDPVEFSSDPKIDDLKFWIISMDMTIMHGPGEPSNPIYWYWPVEIQSPAYIYNEENIQKVRDVLQSIDKVYRTHCDSSASIHIHIGNGQKGFDLRTIRNFMAFVWTFEEQIATIHPPHYMTDQAFSKPVSTHSLLAFTSQVARSEIELTEDRENQLKDHDKNYVIDSIMKIESIDDAVELLSNPELKTNRLAERLTYSICNLESGREKVKKTIEFRQHQSTLDDEEVYHWITVCRSLVYMTSVVDEEDLIEFCKKYINETVEEFSITEVLMAINLPVQAYYYGVRAVVEKHQKKEEERKQQ
ncbi:hypothetical protein SBOR_6367 [Sclerotinia borealis F-4128]|uniref:Amidoligase enzyme n=1 Tax=Sclerotinia borealis (strain F-4128) TaxID=1432307 RepID=W9C923_SCLBF|nr:hypothetical protein SBOR_6367 [Sclerotinia borealis F-4128]